MRPPEVVVPQDMAERVRFAEETEAMIPELESYVFPPWRWLKWRRLARLMRTRNAALRAANDRTREALRAAQTR
jgi:hypothetical protein